jgi:hypothetical protein
VKVRIDTTKCYLCGKPITERKRDSELALALDHVPPKQFIPKSVRTKNGLNLWKVPAHKGCNGDYKSDEEYFYHNFYPLVQVGNLQTGELVLQDIRRRAVKPQTRGLIRDMLNRSKAESPGGILLPPPMLYVSVDDFRIERVVIKIARGLFYHLHQRFMPLGNCRDIRLCKSPEDVPEVYSLSWGLAQAISVCPKMFSYRIADLDGRHFMSLLFWEAFMFCVAFDDPAERRI